MSFSSLRKWVLDRLALPNRQKTICFWYLLFLLVSTRKHTVTEAARFSGFNKSQFSRLLINHAGLAVYNLHQLSKRQSRQFSASGALLKDHSVPWKMALLIDSTLQSRSSLHTENAQKFNHGKGYVIGHQWTNIVLLIKDMLIPLPPIPFHSTKYCQKHGLLYRTENEAVVQYIETLNLHDYIGPHHPREILVLADSGYDDRKIQKAIAAKKWTFIMALKKTRGVRSRRIHLTTPLSRGWLQVERFFKNHRRAPWQTVRVLGARKKRMEFRIRQITAHLRYVGKVQLICSEFKKRPDGRRKYLACNDLNAKPRQILIAYRLRWQIELFHKEVKMFLGFQDVAAKRFQSVVAHVHWVYCAYILLHSLPRSGREKTASAAERQRHISAIMEGGEKARIIQLLTQFGGIERYKAELKAALNRP